MTDFEFQQIDLPQHPKRHLPENKPPQAASRITPPCRYIPVPLRKSCTMNAYRLFQLKRSPSFRVTGQFNKHTRQATVEDLKRDFHREQQSWQPHSEQDIRLVIHVGQNPVPISLLRTLYMIVREGSQTHMLEEDLYEEYLSIVKDLQKIKTLQSGANFYRVLLEEIEVRVRKNEEEKMCNEGPSEQEINLMEEYLMDIRSKNSNKGFIPTEGLLDSLTSESIFDQKNTIQLIKKSMFTHYGYFSENAVDSEEQQENQGASGGAGGGSFSDCQERARGFDSKQIQKYLKAREKKGQIEEVQIMREILSWRKDLKRIIKMM